MTRTEKLLQLRKDLLALPVSEREAIIRRAKLRSIDGTNSQKPQQFHLDILCKLAEHDCAEKHPDCALPRHDDCPPHPPVEKHGKSKRGVVPEGPINNFPSYDYDTGGVPDAVTLEIFSLRRRNAELTAKVEGLNNKITKALEILYSLRRFVQLWIFEGQGESYDQVTGRLNNLDGAIKYLEDRTAGPSAALPMPERWKKAKN